MFLPQGGMGRQLILSLFNCGLTAGISINPNFFFVAEKRSIILLASEIPDEKQSVSDSKLSLTG